MKHDTSQNLGKLFFYTESLISVPHTFFQASWAWGLGEISNHLSEGKRLTALGV